MKRMLLTLAAFVVLAGPAFSGDPPDDDAIREEIVELRRLVELLNARIVALEERLGDKLYPWEREQPFLWDSREPVRPPVLMHRRR